MVSEFAGVRPEPVFKRRNSGELKVDLSNGSGSPGGTLGSEVWSSTDLSGSDISALEKQVLRIYNANNNNKSGGTEPKKDEAADCYQISNHHHQRQYEEDEEERGCDRAQDVADSNFDNYEFLSTNNNNNSAENEAPSEPEHAGRRSRPDATSSGVIVEVDQKVEVLGGNDAALNRELSAICSRSSSMSPLSVSDVSSPSADGDTSQPISSEYLAKGEPTTTDMEARMAELMERERKVQEREKYLQSLELKLMDSQGANNNSIQVSPIPRQLNPELDEDPSEVSMNWPEFGGTVKTIGSNSPTNTEPNNHLTDYEKMVASLAAVDAVEQSANMCEEDITTAEHNVSRPPDPPVAKSPHQAKPEIENEHLADNINTPKTPPSPSPEIPKSRFEEEPEPEQQQQQHHQPDSKPAAVARVKEVKERLSRLEGRMASSSGKSTASESPKVKENRNGVRKVVKKGEPVAVQTSNNNVRSVVPQMSQIIGDNPLDLQQIGKSNGRAPMREREGVTLHQPVVAQQRESKKMPTSPQSPTPSGGSQGDLYPLFLEFMHSLEGRRDVGGLAGIPSSAASSASAHSQQSAHRVPHQHHANPINHSSTRRAAALSGRNVRSRGEVSSSLYPDYFNRFHSYDGSGSTFQSGGAVNLDQIKRDSKVRLQELRKSHIRDRDQMAKRMPSAERRRKDREKIRGTLTPSSSQSVPNSGSGKGRVGRARNASVELRRIGRSNSRDGPRTRVSPSPSIRIGRTQSADRQLGRSNSARSNGSVGRPRPAWRPGGGSPSVSPLVARRTFSPSSQPLQKDTSHKHIKNTNKGIRARSPATAVRIGTAAPKRLVVTPRDTSSGRTTRRWM